ncbi:MAG: long-chain acyl-CoA synthetase, partial [Acidobacteriaceae bacterium]|nr:long-chain acyl-CoA synthetase [Acidobacteriaceae bacterium]
MRPHLATLLDDFRRFGDETAVVRYVGVRRRVSSYAEIARLAGRFAALLVGRGIGLGDRVVLWGENGAEWVAAFYGCMLRGVIAVPLDAYGTAEFAARVAADVRPSLVVGDAELLLTLEGEWPKVCFEDWVATLPIEEAGPVAELSHDTPLQILFTSGTTGEPKGIVHTHGNVLASVEPIADAARGYMRFERVVHPLRFLHTLPLSHVFGQTMGLWIPPILAAEVHFESRLSAARLIETIRRERISVLAGVPRVLAMLKSYLEGEYPDLPARLTAAQGISAIKRWWRFRDIHAAFGLKFWAFITGGGALPAAVEQFWNGLGFVLVQGYGMSETAALITLNHPFHVAKGTMGKPLPGREVKVQPDGEVLVRGAMISAASWSGGSLHRRAEEWLATGDLAETQVTGELRFLGRKSETIVTGAGVNVHPEDLEAALEQEPEVAACAVVPAETALGPEACAVLVLRGSPERAGAVLQNANARLAEFQRIRRWAIWPEPDLPRTSTGKVKRAVVTAWLASQEEKAGRAASASGTDWLLALITHVTGEGLPGDQEGRNSNDLRLSEDLRLDSLGRVQLLDALEERLGVAVDQEEYARVETLGELRHVVTDRGNTDVGVSRRLVESGGGHGSADSNFAGGTREFETQQEAESRHVPADRSGPVHARYVYPHWPWLWPVRWVRAAFVECVMRPLVWLLAAPRVVRTNPGQALAGNDPMLIIANHVTAYDEPLLLYALPRAIRNRIAAAMSGEMLEDIRHARNVELGWLAPLGPMVWLLLTALFNAFPLPRQRGFQRSFAHAGEALDHGFHVVVFPEGRRSAEGALANFRPGIGLLVKQSSAAVLPMALRGMGDLKRGKRRWFRSGTLEVVVGQPIRFAASESEAAITARLHSEV